MFSTIKKIWLGLILLAVKFSVAQTYSDITTTGANGGGSQFAPCTEILRFDNYNDAIAGAGGGQNFVLILTSGDSLFFNLQRIGSPVHSVTSPACGSCSAFGLDGYTGLQGLPDLYQIDNAPSDNTQFIFSNILLKNRYGNIIPGFTMMVFDCEATEPYEDIKLTAPGALTWNYYDSVAPSVAGYTRPAAAGLGTSALTWQGTYPNAVAPFLDDGFSINSPPNFQVSLSNNGTPGLEGVAVGIKRRIIALPDSICAGGNIIINPLNAPPGTTYTWSNPVISPAGSVTGATAQLIPTDSIKQTLTHNGVGASTVTYTITPSSCGIVDSPFTAVIVIGANAANPISLGNDTSYCGPFTRVLSTGIPSTVWSTGVTSAQITVSAPGTYRATVQGSCGPISDSITLTQNPVPNVFLGNDTALCTGQALLLNATNGNLTYRWQDNSTNGTYNVTTSGTYSVTVTNSNGCSASSSIQVSYVTQPPPVNLGNDTSYCGTFTRNLSTGIANTFWSTGVTASQITVATPGTYWATVSNGCGSNSDTITLTQNQVPNVFLGNDTSLCTGQTLLLNAGNGNSTYQWQDNSTNATYNVTAAGTYSVTVTNSTGCSASSSVQINYVSQPPPVNIGNDTAYCGNFTRTLSTGAPNTIWSTGVTAAQITITSPGTYWAMESNGCGANSDTIVITQNPLPVVNLGNDTTLCTGQALLLNATNQNSTYRWQDNSTTPTYNVTTAGTYSVTVTNAFSCASIDSVQVNYVSQSPQFNLGSDTTYCQQFSRVLSTGVASTLWSTSAVGSQININGPGTYWAQASNACGTTTDSIVIAEFSPPQITFPGTYSVCTGVTALLQPNTTGTDFLWNTGANTPSISATQPGTYNVEVWNNIACPNNASVTVSQGSPPTISLGNDTTICGNTGITLSLNVPNAHYVWQDNSVDSFYNVGASGVYSVTVSNNCGSATAKTSIVIYPDECALHIPTAFSPNGDGKNDIFRALSHCPIDKFSIHVYNRWGQLLYESNDVTVGWDGTFKGIAQPLDVYVYYTEYFNYCKGAMDFKSGNVTLLR
jgi:gliding motility-associated-like protein